MNCKSTDQYQHIRNATARITYANQTFLVDPFLAPKESMAGFPGTHNSQQRMPLVDLPMPVEKIMEGVDAVIVTHTHEDHWDETAQQAVPKNLPIFVQHESDAGMLRTQGFKDVRILHDSVTFNGVSLTRTGGGSWHRGNVCTSTDGTDSGRCHGCGDAERRPQDNLHHGRHDLDG